METKKDKSTWKLKIKALKKNVKVTYKDIIGYIEDVYGFKVHTSYIAEVKRELGLPMACNRSNGGQKFHPTEKHRAAIIDALKHFRLI